MVTDYIETDRPPREFLRERYSIATWVCSGDGPLPSDRAWYGFVDPRKLKVRNPDMPKRPFWVVALIKVRRSRNHGRRIGVRVLDEFRSPRGCAPPDRFWKDRRVREAWGGQKNLDLKTGDVNGDKEQK